MEAQPTWRLRAQALTLGALAVALERLPPGPLARFDQLLRGDNPLATALRYIEDQLHLPLPIPVLATICHLSVDHFARVFRQRFGQTPTAYVQERRVAVAAERLVAGNEDIDAIATATGFANRYHFTRVFTHRMGTPPAAYRRRGRV
jgi:transcriptional regulator GlxA family with amidase domain